MLLCFTVGVSLDEFSIEVHHGGFFVGNGHLRSYVNEKVNWFDHIEIDTWSPLWLDQFVVDLGYLRTGSLKIYWLLPGKDIADGLRIIISDTDTNVMASVVDKFRNLVVYFDHDDSCSSFVWDDIVEKSVADLPKQQSNNNLVREEDQSSKKGSIEEDSRSDSGSDESDEDFLDSDYELNDGDDDLFSDHVDGEKAAKGKKAKASRLKGDVVHANNDEQFSSDDEEMDLLEDDDGDANGGMKVKFKTWREVDMNNPTFKVGLVFSSVQHLRDAIAEYNVGNRVQIKMPRNEKQRIRAHCAEGCSWNLFA